MKNKESCHFQYSAAKRETVFGRRFWFCLLMAASPLKAAAVGAMDQVRRELAFLKTCPGFAFFSLPLAVCPAADKTKPAGGGSGVHPPFTTIPPPSSPQHLSHFLC